MSERKPAALSSIADAPLIDQQGNRIVAKTLWADQPVLFLLIRRPGCVLCRAEARRVWALKQSFDILGVKPVCVVHEWLKGEVAAFSPAFWAGDLYFDINKALYRALGDGKVPKQSWSFFLRNMFTVFKLFKVAEKEWVPGHKQNSKGTHMIMGGFLLVGEGQKGVQWMFTEDFWGDHPTMERILQQSEDVSGKKLSQREVDAQMRHIRSMMLKFSSFKL